MTLIERLRAADISSHGEYSELVREAAAEIERLRAALERLIDYLQDLEMAYDQRRDEKLDIQEMKTLAGYALGIAKAALTNEQEEK